jgi:hypothetical protein
MPKFFILIALIIVVGALTAQGETPMEKSRRLSEGVPGAERDSLWWEGMFYREWIEDVNSVGDENENLDPEIFFIEDGNIRCYPSRVYFYNDIDLAIRIAAETKFPLAFHLMDHSCADCLYAMPGIYMNQEVIEKSRNFVNVYVHYPYKKDRIAELGMMTSASTVQFLLPGLRRLRVLTDPDSQKLLETFDLMLDYISKLSPEELIERPK